MNDDIRHRLKSLLTVDEASICPDSTPGAIRETTWPGKLLDVKDDLLDSLDMVRSTNPGSEGVTNHSTGGLMLHHLQDMCQVRGPRQAIKGLH